ncbi:hypothetical protein [Candidatus Neptunichlamydia sp. REUL1]|uniref:hypothetical protein n=1 Tax=Candidatus Neptunichlamydia sp. REUL1 TaxID=3064277 RepID=UPI00292F3A33|nr:hypothetical protein [Candidatus Neptunochlamydia sp. REUL1]
MKDYFLNIQDAYRQPIEQFRQARESTVKVKEGLNVEKNSAFEVYTKAFSEAQAREADVYRVGTTTLKVSALPWLAVSAYIVGKVAYTRQFSYKGLLLAGTAFSIGHDLSKVGHNLQRVHVMSEKDVSAEDVRRKLNHSPLPKQSEFLLNVLVWVVSKPIELKVGVETMSQKIEILSESSLDGRIQEDVTAALKGTVAKDIEIAVQANIASAHEWMFG